MPIHTSLQLHVIDLAKDDAQPPPISSGMAECVTTCSLCQSTSCRCSPAKQSPDSPAETVVAELEREDFAKAPVEAGNILQEHNSNDAAPRKRTNTGLSSSPQIQDPRRKPRSFSSDFHSSYRPTLYSPISSTYHVTPPTSPTTSFSASSPTSKSHLASPRTPSPSALATTSGSNFDRDPDPYVDITRLRIRSRGTDCLYPGAIYKGTQKSGRNTYDVTVTIVDVDMESSFLCGYLKICGLIDTWPEIITYFDAEIIGERYGFLTQDWGATESEDMTHWGRFKPFSQIKNETKRPMLTVKESHCQKRGVVFMRWKERFLVPDHRVKDIDGASFAGFYYVCMDFDNASRGSPSSPTNTTYAEDYDCDRSSKSPSTATMTGYYYHPNSEPHQQLSLSHVPQKTISHFEML